MRRNALRAAARAALPDPRRRSRLDVRRLATAGFSYMSRLPRTHISYDVRGPEIHEVRLARRRYFPVARPGSTTPCRSVLPSRSPLLRRLANRDRRQNRPEGLGGRRHSTSMYAYGNCACGLRRESLRDALRKPLLGVLGEGQLRGYGPLGVGWLPRLADDLGLPQRKPRRIFGNASSSTGTCREPSPDQMWDVLVWPDEWARGWNWTPASCSR